MAEQNYEKEKLYEIKMKSPKFELRNAGCSGRYKNLNSILKNVSENMVSGIKSISLDVINENNDIITTSDKVISKLFSLSPGQETEIQFNNADLISDKDINIGGLQIKDSLKKITIVWSFMCEDSNGNIHYFRATDFIEDSQNLSYDLWKVVKVG